MLTLLIPLLVTLLRIKGLPGNDPREDYARPTSSMAPKYIELLEQNSHLVYPGLAVLTMGLIVFGILAAWRSSDLDVGSKLKFKNLILIELRRYVQGLTGEQLARAIGLEKARTVRLLQQMQEEGMVHYHATSKKQAVWRVKLRSD